MQTTRKKVITRVLGLTYALCIDTYTNTGGGQPLAQIFSGLPVATSLPRHAEPRVILP